MTLTPALLLRAYAAGVFPMARDGDDSELLWFDPDPRTILPLKALHVPRRLARTARQAPYRLAIDTAFRRVIERCGPARPEKTWINGEIFTTCLELHRLGFAHSIEAWWGEELVGGLYGIALGGAFFGESMFSTATDASKLCLLYLVAHLSARGFSLLDVQFTNDHLTQFGTVEISRDEYHQRLEKALGQQAIF
jgi:leucyl/phenylalanyl-tRNA--protein transferase